MLLSSARTASRLSLFPTPPPERVDWRWTRSWEGTQQGQLTPLDQSNSPYHMMSWSAIKAQGKEEGGMLIVKAFVFSSNHYACRGSASQDVANICLPMGNSE